MTYGPMREGDLAEVAEILGSAFGFPAEESSTWITACGSEHVRVLRAAEAVLACTFVVPMGHYLGGRSVRTLGIAGVGVALERRNRGVALELMQASLREADSEGFALSTLYPATQTLYRRAGYERAGKVCVVCIPASTFAARKRPAGPELELRRLGPGDERATEDLYAEVARQRHGYLDRGPYIWRRVRAPRGKVARGFGFFHEDRLEGYLYMVQERPDPSEMNHVVRLTDLVGVTPRALHAMLRFLHDQRSTMDEVVLKGGPSEPILTLLDEAIWSETAEHDWMVRVVSVERALSARGYPAGLRATVAIHVEDDLFAANTGAFTLSVDDGSGAVTRGGSGGARLDVRAFASLYTGYLLASALRRLGLLDADDACVATLDAVFGGPMPSMSDMF